MQTTPAFEPSGINLVGIVGVSAALIASKRPAGSIRGRPAGLGAFELIVLVVGLTTWSIAVSPAASGDHGAEHATTGDTTTESRRGSARVELGDDRFAQVLVGASDPLDQVHVTFFDSGGQSLDVDSASMVGTSPSGATLEIPILLLEPGHFAASVDLEAGAWSFELQGVPRQGPPFDVSFSIKVENPLDA